MYSEAQESLIGDVRVTVESVEEEPEMAMSASARPRRAEASLSASTVRAPSTVSARLSVSTPQDALSRR